MVILCQRNFHPHFTYGRTATEGSSITWLTSHSWPGMQDSKLISKLHALNYLFLDSELWAESWNYYSFKNWFATRRNLQNSSLDNQNGSSVSLSSSFPFSAHQRDSYPIFLASVAPSDDVCLTHCFVLCFAKCITNWNAKKGYRRLTNQTGNVGLRCQVDQEWEGLKQ